LFRQDGWILAKFFLCKLTKKERGPYTAFLTEQAWLIKRVVPSRQDSSILPAQVANHSTGFDSSCPLAELAAYNNGKSRPHIYFSQSNL